MAEGDLIRMGIGIDTLSLDHGPSKDFPTRQFTHFAPFSVRLEEGPTGGSVSGRLDSPFLVQ
jgi:hypothetical protein